MKKIEDLKIKIFSDGARIEDFKALANLSDIEGFTTNPSLMRKAGTVDYEEFINKVLPIVDGKPVSFEVISDDFEEMKKQAIKLSKFGENVYVKIPITNTKGVPSIPLVEYLMHKGIKINVTAILTIEQVRAVKEALAGGGKSIVSVFAGRIADTGTDPIPMMKQASETLKDLPNAELLWASCRELLNIFHAETAGCDIITVPPDILKKLQLVGYDHGSYSLDTVKRFYQDAGSSGLKL